MKGERRWKGEEDQSRKWRRRKSQEVAAGEMREKKGAWKRREVGRGQNKLEEEKGEKRRGERS